MTAPLAIFDLDGTLVDSRALIQSAMQAAFRAHGLRPPSYDETRRTVGLAIEEVMAILAPAVAPRLRVRLTGSFQDAFVEMRRDPSFREPLYDGAAALVWRLAEAGWRLGIATGKPRRGIDAFFETHGLRAAFDTSWSVDDGPGKPHPFMIDQAVAAVSVCKTRAVMIGDSVHDIKMARTARVQAFGVAWGFQTADEVAAAGAHQVFEDFAGLAGALAAFGADEARADGSTRA